MDPPDCSGILFLAEVVSVELRVACVLQEPLNSLYVAGPAEFGKVLRSLAGELAPLVD